jgi:hypothetical protein
MILFAFSGTVWLNQREGNYAIQDQKIHANITVQADEHEKKFDSPVSKTAESFFAPDSNTWRTQKFKKMKTIQLAN